MSESTGVVERICSDIWNTRINRTDPNNLWLMCEEAETYLRNIRGDKAEEFYRLVHIGRNINVRCILITTDLALLDASIIRLCQIRFHGLLGIEENAKRKFRAYYGKDITEQATQLETGQFLRLHKKRLEFIKVREFTAKRRPQLYLHFDQPEKQSEPQKQAEPRKPLPKPRWLNNLLTAISSFSR